jgi:hypothetical protein
VADETNWSARGQTLDEATNPGTLVVREVARLPIGVRPAEAVRIFPNDPGAGIAHSAHEHHDGPGGRRGSRTGRRRAVVLRPRLSNSSLALPAAGGPALGIGIHMLAPPVPGALIGAHESVEKRLML